MADIRYAFRVLARTPIISLIVVASLALGIGANTAIFSMIHQIILRSLPVEAPEELAFFYQPGPAQGRTSSDDKDMPAFHHPMFRELQQRQTSFTGIAGFRASSASISYQGSAVPGRVNLVSGNYFQVLGLKPTIGRLFTEDDDKTPGAHSVVVLDHGFWTRQLGARADVLNQSITVNGHPLTVVGIATAKYQGETPGREVDVYVPIRMKAQMTPNWNGLDNRKDYWVNLVGRIKPGVTLKQAEEVINGPYHAMLEEEAKLLTQPSPRFLEQWLKKRIVLRAFNEGRGGMKREARVPLYLLTGITGFVLLIACANAANLLLAKASGRRKEIAIRLSMGASRARLVRQLLAEALVLSVGGGILGIAVANWTMNATLRFVPPSANSGFLTDDLPAPVLLYCLAISLLTGLVFGLYPAWQATRTQVATTLKDQGASVVGAASGKAFRNSLVVGQVALSLLLLFSAGLFSMSLVKLTRVDLGIDPDRLITFSLRPSLSNYNAARSVALFEQLEDKLSATPGVKMVSGSMVPVIAGDNWNNSINVEGYSPADKEDVHSSFSEVGPGFFATMGTPLIGGREFTRRDSAGAPKVAIVNESFVKRFCQGRNPIGMRMGSDTGPQAKRDIEIVGVVKDSRYSDLNSEQRAVYYTPYRQDERLGSLYFYVRTTIEPEQFAAIIRREVARLDPNVPVDRLRTMNAQIDESIFVQRLISTFAATFAGLATLLAAIGLYGVLAYTVTQRTREIGIRMALGANATEVRGLVLREVGLLLGIGVVIGAAGALAVGQLFESVIFGVKARDPFVLAGSVAVLSLVAILAGSLPARRATKIDPMVALRYE
ncbi:MAG: ABC transporter permease [Acidobacteria bacterium]|nr:ABC transporter permease [Acidobacteriota bacterium]